MYAIHFEGQEAQNHAQETVLDTFLRHSIEIPFSCRQGICHTCILQAKSGNIPTEAQEGLTEMAKQANHFLPCVCVPTEDMELEMIPKEEKFHMGTIRSKVMLSSNVCELCIEVDEDIEFQAGQYIQIKKHDTPELRPYSITSVPYVDSFLCLHIKQIPNGKFSEWICQELVAGDRIEFQAPQGTCYYGIIPIERPLLLIGTGTGLAPLIGIAKQALWLYDHQGPIYLYHGSSYSTGIYYHQQLEELANTHDNFHYFPLVSRDEHTLFSKGLASEIALESHKDLTDYFLFLCGNPNMVEEAYSQAISQGAQKGQIFKDPFFFQNKKSEVEADVSYEFREEDPTFPSPDLDMWKALKEGELLTTILTDFYTKVYADPLLSPFFESVTLRRAVEKQYSFLYQAFTGKQVYLGEMPRNAHNWMVITDEIFDHREALFEASLRKFNLEEKLIRRWLILNESYRDRLVKISPWSKIIDGVVFPVGNFEEILAEIPMLCDNCEGEIQEGEYVRYHSRLGKTYCKDCYQ